MRMPDFLYRPCLATVLGLALSAGCGSAGAPSPVGEQVLQVTLQQTEPPTGYAVQLTNNGQVPVAVCPCIGPPTRFIVFDLYYEDEDRRLSPPEILYSGGRLRRFYHCLEPGESLRVPVDFRRWEPIWDQQREAFPPFNLLVGPGSYRARARYIDSGEISRRGCAGFRGRVASEWVEFDAPRSGPAK